MDQILLIPLSSLLQLSTVTPNILFEMAKIDPNHGHLFQQELQNPIYL
jgi:hypothetical protein